MIRPLAVAVLLSACATDKDDDDRGEIGYDPHAGHTDADGDGYPADEDCDDADGEVFPGADEVCDGVDNDCNGEVDEGVTTTYYLDSDADGYGDDAGAVEACEAPEDTSEVGGDCDDGDPEVSPAATERCNEVDDDCDGEVDEDVQETWYADADDDGFGDASTTTEDCDPPEGFVADPTDCDDTDAAVNPEATEVCNSLDDDCDGLVDDDDDSLDLSTATTWYADADTDGYGDAAVSTVACEAPAGFVDDDADCDDSSAAVSPAGREVCDEIDNDCDGLVDDDDPSVDTGTGLTFYADGDGDGYGDLAAALNACEQPSGHVLDDSDCDDGDGAVNPGATEVCNELDDDCDGDIDDADASLDTSTASTWYADSDGDGYGDADVSTETCEEPSGYSSDDSDCDDGDADVNPGATEVWYDGTDADCDGASDYDADGDGDDSEDYGGGDCDDTDATVYEGVGCRPEAGCTAPDTTTLESDDPSGAADLHFDGDCVAYVPTVISGTDYVYLIDSTGHVDTITGYSNYNIPAIALDPGGSGEVAAAGNDNSSAAVGFGDTSSSVGGGTSVSYATGSSWSNTYLNRGHSSIAWDSSDLIWVPNIAGNGTFGSIDYSSGSSSTLASSLGARVESVALDSSEAVFISVDDEIYEVDTSTGSTSLYFTAGGTVLDMVFDYNDDLYVETDADEVELVPGDGSASSVYDTVSGDGKLAISPDGLLVRIIPNPLGAASYESWDLD